MGHFKHADLIGGAKTVFGSAQQTVRSVAVTLKIEHGVYHMFQHFRACDAAVLVYVSHQDHRGAAGLCKLQKLHGAFPHLGDAARSRLQLGVEHGLNGVNDHDGGLELRSGKQDLVDLCFRADQQIVPIDVEPVGSHFDLG